MNMPIPIAVARDFDVRGFNLGISDEIESSSNPVDRLRWMTQHDVEDSQPIAESPVEFALRLLGSGHTTPAVRPRLCSVSRLAGAEPMPSSHVLQRPN